MSNNLSKLGKTIESGFKKEISLFGGVSILGGIMVGSGIFYLDSYVVMRSGMRVSLTEELKQYKIYKEMIF